MRAGLRNLSGLFLWLALAWFCCPAHAQAEPSETRAWQSALRFGGEWANDQLYGSDGDDLGFTQDLGVQVHYVGSRDDFSLRARQRLMIERTGDRRTDEVTFELGW